MGFAKEASGGKHRQPHSEPTMSEEMVNPVHDSPSTSADGGPGSFEKDGGAKSFETEDEDGPPGKKTSRRAGIKTNLKGGLDVMKGGVDTFKSGAADKVGGAAQLTSVKDLMKFADLAGEPTPPPPLPPCRLIGAGMLSVVPAQCSARPRRRTSTRTRNRSG